MNTEKFEPTKEQREALRVQIDRCFGSLGSKEAGFAAKFVEYRLHAVATDALPLDGTDVRMREAVQKVYPDRPEVVAALIQDAMDFYARPETFREHCFCAVEPLPDNDYAVKVTRRESPFWCLAYRAGTTATQPGGLE